MVSEILKNYKETLNKEKSVVIPIKVSTKMPKTRFVSQMEDGTLKMSVNAAPEKGKANKEIIKFLAREFGVPKSCIQILSGETSPHKMIRIKKE